jgi:phosphatidylserine synthase
MQHLEVSGTLVLYISGVQRTARLNTRNDHLQLGIIDEVTYNQGFPSTKDVVFVTCLRRAYLDTAIL